MLDLLALELSESEMKQRYVTVLIDDLPMSVVKTESYAKAISIAARLSDAAIAERSRTDLGLEIREGGRRRFRCRKSSLPEIEIFERNDVKWQEAHLVAVLL